MMQEMKLKLNESKIPLNDESKSESIVPVPELFLSKANP